MFITADKARSSGVRRRMAPALALGAGILACIAAPAAELGSDLDGLLSYARSSLIILGAELMGQTSVPLRVPTTNRSPPGRNRALP